MAQSKRRSRRGTPLPLPLFFSSNVPPSHNNFGISLIECLCVENFAGKKKSKKRGHMNEKIIIWRNKDNSRNKRK
jgi:hypothetical protein